MREKPANELAVNNLIDFLNDTWLGCMSSLKNDLPKSIQTFKVAKRTAYDIFKLGIVKTDTKDKQKLIWLKEEPTRRMALQILDYRLKKTKKTVHFPIPEFASIADSLKQITDRLMQLSVQQERLFRTAKTDVKSNEQDLFRVDDQRLYIAGQIASGVYSVCEMKYLMQGQIIDCNDLIISATDDLMSKLLKHNDHKE